MGRIVGVVVGGSKVIMVDAEIGEDESLTVIADQSFPLPNGDRSVGYSTIYQRCSDYFSENDIDGVVVKASASTGRGGGVNHLRAAEIRGVVIAAAAAHRPVTVLAKAQISRHFGERKADEYLVDDSFWDEVVPPESLRKGSREAALLILASAK